MIGIHDRPGSFSDRWIGYCAEHSIPFRRVNCLSSDVVQQCAGLKAVLWHWSHTDSASQLVARQIIASIERLGVAVFPSLATCWHFDDKLAQKYLLEAISAPLIPTWIFTNKEEAEEWIEKTSWPKVFKLRRGAGSINVRLVRSRSEAESLCRRAFGRGFPASAGYFTDMQTRIRKTKSPRHFWERLLRAPKTIKAIIATRRQMMREQGYLYFQEFMPDNVFDTRITVIGNRAFGFMRANRPNDFRASGSGAIVYDSGKIDPRFVRIAFEVTERIGAQSLAFDFLFNQEHEPVIGEISYCYMATAVHACKGHWNRKGEWQEGNVWPEEAILVDVLAAGHQRSTN